MLYQGLPGEGKILVLLPLIDGYHFLFNFFLCFFGSYFEYCVMI